jgi:hypothetical protein
LTDGHHDLTTAYRLFMQDAIPFRKHIRVGIEHGTGNSVQEDAWTLAYYYYQPAARAKLTDQLDVGNTVSEAAHSYAVSGQTWSGSQTNSYDGNADNINITDDGRAHKGYSEFTMALPAANAGVILRRRLDQGIANQSASVYVDGTLVGKWYRAGSNTDHRWRDDDFMIPASFTTGKKSLQFKIESLASAHEWTEFGYRLYALEPVAAMN